MGKQDAAAMEQTPRCPRLCGVKTVMEAAAHSGKQQQYIYTGNAVEQTKIPSATAS
jgi:hypothetical protein